MRVSKNGKEYPFSHVGVQNVSNPNHFISKGGVCPAFTTKGGRFSVNFGPGPKHGLLHPLQYLNVFETEGYRPFMEYALKGGASTFVSGFNDNTRKTTSNKHTGPITLSSLARDIQESDASSATKEAKSNNKEKVPLKLSKIELSALAARKVLSTRGMIVNSKCVNNHNMIQSTFSGGNYSGGHFCDLCRRNGSPIDARWYCSTCGIDYCFRCRPVENYIEKLKPGESKVGFNFTSSSSSSRSTSATRGRRVRGRRAGSWSKPALKEDIEEMKANMATMAVQMNMASGGFSFGQPSSTPSSTSSTTSTTSTTKTTSSPFGSSSNTFGASKVTGSGTSPSPFTSPFASPVFGSAPLPYAVTSPVFGSSPLLSGTEGQSLPSFNFGGSAIDGSNNSSTSTTFSFGNKQNNEKKNVNENENENENDETKEETSSTVVSSTVSNMVTAVEIAEKEQEVFVAKQIYLKDDENEILLNLWLGLKKELADLQTQQATKNSSSNAIKETTTKEMNNTKDLDLLDGTTEVGAALQTNTISTVTTPPIETTPSAPSAPSVLGVTAPALPTTVDTSATVPQTPTLETSQINIKNTIKMLHPWMTKDSVDTIEDTIECPPGIDISDFVTDLEQMINKTRIELGIVEEIKDELNLTLPAIDGFNIERTSTLISSMTTTPKMKTNLLNRMPLRYLVDILHAMIQQMKIKKTKKNKATTNTTTNTNTSNAIPKDLFDTQDSLEMTLKKLILFLSYYWTNGHGDSISNLFNIDNDEMIHQTIENIVNGKENEKVKLIHELLQSFACTMVDDARDTDIAVRKSILHLTGRKKKIYYRYKSEEYMKESLLNKIHFKPSSPGCAAAKIRKPSTRYQKKKEILVLEVLPGWLRIGTNEWIVTTADLEPVPWSLTYNIQQSTIQGYVECSLLQNVHEKNEKNEKNKTMSTFNNTNHNNNKIFKHGRLWCSSSFNTFIPSSIPAQVLALRMYEPIAVLSRTERISIPNASKLKIVQIALPQSKLIAATADDKILQLNTLPLRQELGPGGCIRVLEVPLKNRRNRNQTRNQSTSSMMGSMMGIDVLPSVASEDQKNQKEEEDKKINYGQAIHLDRWLPTPIERSPEEEERKRLLGKSRMSKRRNPLWFVFLSFKKQIKLISKKQFFSFFCFVFLLPSSIIYFF